MDIINLRDAPQYLPTLARWHHAQWTYLNPGRTLQQRIVRCLLPRQPRGKVLLSDEPGATQSVLGARQQHGAE